MSTIVIRLDEDGPRLSPRQLRAFRQALRVMICEDAESLVVCGADDAVERARVALSRLEKLAPDHWSDDDVAAALCFAAYDPGTFRRRNAPGARPSLLFKGLVERPQPPFAGPPFLAAND